MTFIVDCRFNNLKELSLGASFHCEAENIIGHKGIRLLVKANFALL